MNRRRFIAALTAAGWLHAQDSPPVEFVCPMDKDVRSNAPGFCPRCGMKLVAGIPESREFRVSVSKNSAGLTLVIVDPLTGGRATHFETMHEKLYHLYVVSQDLEFFAHIHPQIQADASFRVPLSLPHPGLYRLLSDFYPSGATPQLITSSIFGKGGDFPLEPAHPQADLSPQQATNVTAELVTEPVKPLAGFQTLLFFRLTPGEGVEPYLGAMGHMLAVSGDLIDMTHTHPIYVTDAAAGVKQVQFNMIFPREGVYRVWVQFQRKGVVNTVAFNVPVKGLSQ